MTRRRLSQLLPFVCLIALASAPLACAGGGGGTGRRDSGSLDAEPGDGGAGECRVDGDCEDDGIFCNGRLACMDGRCVAAEIPTCDDGVRCTRDTCLAATDACQSTPDDSACPDGTVCYVGAGCTAAPPCEFDTDCLGDGVYCNGDEVCVAGMCMSPSGGRGCDDGNSCTVDECVEASSACANTPYPDFLTNPMHCGTGANDCVACPMPDSGAMHVTASCDAGACGFACESGWFDTDGNLMNGCECSSPPGSADDPDDSFADTNCDGIDGDESRAIFVAPSGRDTNPGTRALPKRTLAAGILAAQAAGFDVYVSRGDYELVDTLELANGVDIYGGYDASMGWARSDSFIVNINGTTTAVRARNISSPTTIDRINVRAANNTAFGGASIGVHAVDSPGLRWRVSLVRAASGGPGRDGTSGTTGGSGSAGRDSVGGVE